jgi:glucosyl-3-phosphoglycerate synthase
MSVSAERWVREHTWHHSRFSCELVAAEREATVSVCLPARNEAPTIGPIIDALLPLLEAGAIDQLAVVDDSSDGTGDIARARGAEVFDQSELCPGLGRVCGKGDAMWRALSVLHGEVVCYLDADSERFGPHFATALVGAVALPGPVQFVKAFYRRPFRVNDEAELATGGGRVTELTARPLLKAFYPELAEIRQPLAGEIAGRRELLERLPFAHGYAVDIGLLIDAWSEVGLEGLAQVDLDVRQNRHRPLEELGPMAEAVLTAVMLRLKREGRLDEDVSWAERPAMRTYQKRTLALTTSRTPLV